MVPDNLLISEVNKFMRDGIQIGYIVTINQYRLKALFIDGKPDNAVEFYHTSDNNGFCQACSSFQPYHSLCNQSAYLNDDRGRNLMLMSVLSAPVNSPLQKKQP